MLESLLIANRGEIACRITRSARRLGVRCIAVYSEADARAAHVQLADEAYLIGPAPAAESYLNVEAVLAAARRGGAQAVHPGYGFLSENAGFAEACAAAGLVFVGPPPAAIRAMGSKSEAKAIMDKAGVPLVPGYHGAEQDPARLEAAAREIGFPVLVKASAGGGGKGMRVVKDSADFGPALEAAKRESAAAFGDDRVLIEKYLQNPRHIEMQVFGDSHGNVVHLFERDCSIQRRHQKVLEEAPAPGLSEARRGAMGDAAVAAARAIGYVGAGTVEFIAEGEDFYFIEMNTRLQVEHPVTEMITGQDLVEWQLRVAAGETLPFLQNELGHCGHAIEVRIYAEDPQRDFLPSTGRLTHLRFPDGNRHLRVDSGVRTGDEITLHYDPMIAKLIVGGADRDAALGRLRLALAATEIAGLSTNLGFLRAMAAHPAVARAELDTGYIDRHRDEVIPAPAPASDEVLALACLAEILRRKAESERAARRSSDPHSPWRLTTGWRLNSGTFSKLTFHDGDRQVAVVLHYQAEGYLLELPGGELAVRGGLGEGGQLRAELGGRRITARVIRDGHELTVLFPGVSHRLRLHDPLDLGSTETVGGSRMTAPMPGKVVQIMVEPGADVTRGAQLMVLEAMKMEHAITAPGDGVVSEIHYAEGDLVEEGAELIAFEASEA